MSLPPHALERAVSILPIIQCPGIPASMASDSGSSPTSSADTSTMSWPSTPEQGCREDFSYPHTLDGPKAKRDQSSFNRCLTIIQALQAPLVDLQVFDSVTSTDFNKIVALSAENREYRISAKLVHLPHLNQLIAMPPLAIHKVPIQQFARRINLFLCRTDLSLEDVDRDDDLITLHTNLAVRDGEATTVIIPDLRLDLRPPGGLSLPIWAMESGFSSTPVQMRSQLKAVADIVPELDAAFLVSIRKTKYTPPPKSIPLYTLQPIPPSVFAPPTHTLSFGPVVVEGITWISINSVTFEASLWCEDGQLRFGEGPLFAKGHLFPDLEMKGVDRLLDLAAQRFLQRVAEIMEGMPGVDASRVSQVRSASQTAAFPTHWTKFLHKLQEAVWDTTYHQQISQVLCSAVQRCTAATA
ncbi:hypothetical protein BKA83DRAFT_4497388 [Pisolithus microcarpus]|nr:hypothetical protein BKA83DRAFT_4497388 [Pisolithus microcarpus]